MKHHTVYALIFLEFSFSKIQAEKIGEAKPTTVMTQEVNFYNYNRELHNHKLNIAVRGAQTRLD